MGRGFKEGELGKGSYGGTTEAEGPKGIYRTTRAQPHHNSQRSSRFYRR